MDGVQIRVTLAPEATRDTVAGFAHAEGWRIRWVAPWMAELERGSVGADLVLGPLQPFQRVSLEVFVGPDGLTDVLLWHTQGRWYGAAKSAPRKATRNFQALTDGASTALGDRVVTTTRLSR